MLASDITKRSPTALPRTVTDLSRPIDNPLYSQVYDEPHLPRRAGLRHDASGFALPEVAGGEGSGAEPTLH